MELFLICARRVLLGTAGNACGNSFGIRSLGFAGSTSRTAGTTRTAAGTTGTTAGTTGTAAGTTRTTAGTTRSATRTTRTAIGTTRTTAGTAALCRQLIVRPVAGIIAKAKIGAHMLMEIEPLPGCFVINKI